ncbi:unnamed protein product [Phytophthora fragariaefolia]|uniref:Unnamed protein product n=1 Tax=Phytophthora fragariaefolia TaxID=1490495 RepID=A0A9W6TKN3_9STRA|nr:unnamed protein product [Phytophthora fragariaefolia]
MKYDLVKFRVRRLGREPFVIFTDHALLRTATSSPHLSQRMTRWLSFFDEHNSTIEYKPGKQNVLEDTLTRRPFYELAHLVFLESPLYKLIREAYATDDDVAGLLSALANPDKIVDLTARQRARLHRNLVVEGLLYYQVDRDAEPRIVVPNDDDRRHWVLYEAHDTPLSGKLGRDKTYTSVARSLCMDFIFELPADSRDHTGILVFVCRLSKIVRLAALWKIIMAPQAAHLFVDNVFRRHDPPEGFVSDRDPRSVSYFWQHFFRLLGTRLDTFTADHPQTVGQTERVNRVLEDVLRSVCGAEATSWSTLLPQVEFALNNAVHAWTGYTSFYVNGLRHPRSPLSLPPTSRLGAEGADRGLLDTKNLPTSAVSAVDTKLRPRCIGLIGIHGRAYTLDLPSAMATHPTFYVVLVRPYHPAASIGPSGSDPASTDGGHSPSPPVVPPTHEPGLEPSAQQYPLGGARRDPSRSPPTPTTRE